MKIENIRRGKSFGKNGLAVSRKLKANLSYDLAFVVLCKYPGVMSTFVHKKI